MSERNWAGNVTYRAREIVRPASVDELTGILAREPRVRVLGSRHSFSRIADTAGVLVSLSAMRGEVEVDAAAGRARVPAGLRHGDLVPALEAAGVALANLASLPHISVAGAVQTGTHGSGDRIGALGTQVAAVEMVTAAGETLVLRRGDDDFAGAVVGLGALGVITHLTLEVEPAYEIAQTVFEGARWDDVLSRLDAVTGAGDSVSMFTTWQDPDAIGQVWVKARPGRADHDALRGIGARPADGPRHPLPGIDPTPCTVQGGEPGPWFARLPHFRLEFTPSAGDELQSEYLVDRADAREAIDALRELAPRLAPVLQVCEVRTMAGDDLWMSPAYGRDTVGLHFTWVPDPDAVGAVLPLIEDALPASARPHWGKLFAMDSATLARRYPRWDDFTALRDRLDPDRRFANDYLISLGL
ncbi:D-arabinono-1,4-lactone oxidase [Microbacterium xanthum]|uniref:D-arabinono-1,4-lactone oxidase n=1 Tax=Microbacterium xanthum TaxID=3079794 RepID=UPI002AD26FEE|nr:MULTISPECIES: D-arabinono-1,4-lactone oxidase [unclassified Microbacterium]MDZ8170495.1 FAD-binding protein [Microbacterium sp. KSW-48]MDZ8201017.1 FAD-binding protein [Microbacterium sp. SSW1-59]